MGGGASSSEKGGGLNEGFRRRCIGRLWPEFGSWMCAACGLARPDVGALAGLLSTPVEETLSVVSKGRLFRVGSREEGLFRRRGAPGQPQAECSVSKVVDSGEK